MPSPLLQPRRRAQQMGANRCLLLAESYRWFVALVFPISMVRHWILIIFLDFCGFQMFPAWLSLRIDWRLTRRGPAPICLMGSPAGMQW